jgi:hypothetical protein
MSALESEWGSESTYLGGTNMASAQTQIDLARWQARAIMLAEEHHLVHRACFLGTGVYGESLWEVPSKTTDGAVYVVHVWLETEAACCSCLAAWFARACGHCGAAILAERQKQAAERGSEGDTAMRWFCHGGEWD